MNKNILAGLICLFASGAFSQQTSTSTYVYDGQGNIIGGSHIQTKPGKPVKIQDPATGNSYELDSEHIDITATDKTGKVLWKTDPWKDNKLDPYRMKRPFIVYFKLIDTASSSPAGRYKKGLKTVIAIAYMNTQFGYIEPDTGEFHFEGQD
jgi:hypothetical protein